MTVRCAFYCHGNCNILIEETVLLGRVDHLCETGYLAGSVVLVKNTLLGCLVDDGSSIEELLRCCILIGCLHGCLHAVSTAAVTYAAAGTISP